ncbi:deoxycytidylate deaminase-like isoform X3 [Syngnathus typhle]|uniref:deoxycytidylate deaminase-like isoform X3 n=1 Tax=Syngnathus typhle TaxID=161592 RepID=UPI002A6AAE89|nr:deoxycytidylate deaminase-like isoform X3 [Syngnathus typhle]
MESNSRPKTEICHGHDYHVCKPFKAESCQWADLYSCTTKKREDYLEWPEYFMAVAFLSAQRSKDPNSQVGACIVNQENKIVGIGYNGMPNGCDDDQLPWARSAADRLDTKYPYGIKAVVYLSDKYHDTPEMTASRRLLNMACVQFQQFKPKRTKITIDFNSINLPTLDNSTK